MRMRSRVCLWVVVALGGAVVPVAAQNVARTRQTAIVTAAARLAPAVVSVNVLRRERQQPRDPFDLFSLAEKVSVLGGMKVVTVTAAVRAERGIRSEHGALIYDIPDEMEQATGLRSGDVIVQINRAHVADAADLRRAFTGAAGAGAVTVWFERGGRLGRTSFYVR